MNFKFVPIDVHQIRTTYWCLPTTIERMGVELDIDTTRLIEDILWLTENAEIVEKWPEPEDVLDAWTSGRPAPRYWSL